MRFLSLFSGIGGFDLGLERSGHECIGQVEIDGFCQRVLAARWPNVQRADDVQDIQLAEWWDEDGPVNEPHPGCAVSESGTGRPDLLCGGFPCQDLSVAGKRAGLAGERSGLFYEILRIQTIVQSPWGLFENVPGLFSSHGGRDMASVLEGLRQCWPVVGYRVLDSRYFGVPQRRRRVFFVCGPTEQGVKSVLFEPESGSGDSQTGAEEGPRIAACTPASTLNPGGNSGRFRTEPGEHLVAWALQERDAKGPDSDTKPGHLITHALSSDSTGAGGVATGVGVRRLTPTECERLQGFPDGWTCLCDTDPCKCPDSPRYRALGNAVTVNVIEWLGKNLANMEQIEAQQLAMETTR